MAKEELADDWWNQNKNLITGFTFVSRRERYRTKMTQFEQDIMKYEMEAINYKGLSYEGE